MFSSFAALSGHGAAIQETACLTEQPMELAEDTKADPHRRQVVLLEPISLRYSESVISTFCLNPLFRLDNL